MGAVVHWIVRSTYEFKFAAINRREPTMPGAIVSSGSDVNFVSSANSWVFNFGITLWLLIGTPEM